MGGVPAGPPLPCAPPRPCTPRRPYFDALPRHVPTLAAFYSDEEAALYELGGLQGGSPSTYAAAAESVMGFVKGLMSDHPEVFGSPTPLWDLQLRWTFSTLFTRLCVLPVARPRRSPLTLTRVPPRPDPQPRTTIRR